jgi:hypothetical protein
MILRSPGFLLGSRLPARPPSSMFLPRRDCLQILNSTVPTLHSVQQPWVSVNFHQDTYRCNSLESRRRDLTTVPAVSTRLWPCRRLVFYVYVKHHKFGSMTSLRTPVILWAGVELQNGGTTDRALLTDRFTA